MRATSQTLMEDYMATRVRAKFRCASITDFGGTSKQVSLSAIYAPDANGEDAGFTKATPWGEIKMSIDNPAAAVQFEIGKNYYVDFSPAD
jgi:hypothetical protein